MDISKIMKNTTKKYSDIIYLPHHESNLRPKMSIENRSAQFAPFAALTGYEDLTIEAARVVDQKMEINEDSAEILDEKLMILKSIINLKPCITVTYFEKDLKKNGGKYKSITQKLIKIDDYNNKIIFENLLEINVLDIIEIKGEMLKDF